MRKFLFTWLFIAGWALAQLAIIDHVYSEVHSTDTVCEWCASYGNKFENLVQAEPSVPAFAPQVQSASVYQNPITRQVSRLSPHPRGPPQL